ncbi:SDR family oxidoreductase [Pelagicoccus sp. SDUM812002]|uniref:SDR family oxidoreductase n=1 Tax=Pelagicoccus sp. SDUM812002 TaxID=3041266 RepID=UPI00280E5847|nr:SDR family oxidoreductase [Pelagicoccus sp. SDUM812002]MDQ8185741.1 SDR family oxidoreductase [Pelagicoccus sp. SDUM812002]
MDTKKQAIVTGGERGIGKAIVNTLLRDEFSVAVIGFDTVAAKNLPDSVTFFRCDMANPEAVSESIRNVCASTGKLHALVCNAGIASPERLNLETLSVSDWQRVLDVNLSGPFYCAKAAAPYLRAAEGSIVTIASTRALQSEANTFAYSASKGGLVSLTHSLAVSLGPEVRANCVSPGWILTDSEESTTPRDSTQHPVGRIGTSQDIADIVSYLVGSKSKFISGQNFVVDGGMTKKMIYAD